MSTQRIDVYLTPLVVEVDGAKVTLIEVVPYTNIFGKKRYLVSCQVEWNGWRSPQFTLDVEDNKELESKLKTEIAKMKFSIKLGFTYPFTRIG